MKPAAPAQEAPGKNVSLLDRNVTTPISTPLIPPSDSRLFRLGTRGSPLAKWQAEWIAARLREQGIRVELVLITTSGDVTDGAISTVGGQGVFTKEIQRALIDDRIDLAVHSLKDLPTEPVPGLILAAVPERENPFDALISTKSQTLEDLAPSAHVGTGSRRRQSQVLHLRPDLRVSEIRGNVDTRLRKLDEGQYDAIILAEAGLNRLGLAHRITQILPTAVMLPAVGQGALGIETRADDSQTIAVVELLNHAPTHSAIIAERELLAQLRGGCLAPIGAWARTDGDFLRLTAAVLSPDGRRRISITMASKVADPSALGRRAAHELLEMGAAELIAASRG